MADIIAYMLLSTHLRVPKFSYVIEYYQTLPDINLSSASNRFPFILQGEF